MTSKNAIGTITQVLGAVVDVRFEGDLPEILNIDLCDGFTGMIGVLNRDPDPAVNREQAVWKQLFQLILFGTQLILEDVEKRTNPVFVVVFVCEFQNLQMPWC